MGAPSPTMVRIDPDNTLANIDTEQPYGMIGGSRERRRRRVVLAE
jgi:hypothetical protein